MTFWPTMGLALESIAEEYKKGLLPQIPSYS